MVRLAGTRGRRAVGRRVALIGSAVVGTAIGAVVASGPAPAQTSGCGTTTYVDHTVEICFSEPTPGVTLTGRAEIGVTVDITGVDPGVGKVVFTLDDEYLITDFETPYRFVLPTDTFADATVDLAVVAHLRSGSVTDPVAIPVRLANGLTTVPPAPDGFVPRRGTAPAPGRPLVVAVTGDGAAGRTPATAVVDMIEAMDPNLVLYTGDVYDRGTYTEFLNWYGDGTFYDRLASITNPTLGNHERNDDRWDGYDRYWGTPDPSYSVDAGGWHIVSLNVSNRQGGDDVIQWLIDDLAASTAPCTVVMFHHPVLSVGDKGDTPSTFPLWAAAVDAGVDIVLTGHDHNYQRWNPLDRDLRPDPDGAVHFVAGGGGHGIRPFVRTDSRLAFGIDTVETAYGALRLELQRHGAAYSYVNISGEVVDSGTIQCSGTPPDRTTPTTPLMSSARAPSHWSVALAWEAATDDVGVDHYVVERNGVAVATVPGHATGYEDRTVTGDRTFTYRIRAVDAAGNTSPFSAPTSVRTPATSAVVRLSAVADAWLDVDEPEVNRGAGPDLQVDRDGGRSALVRFEVRGVVEPVVSATLRIRAESSNPAGIDVRGVSGGWAERTVTAADAPPPGAVLAASGPALAGGFVEVDVTGAVTGNGTVNLALTARNDTNLVLTSREGGTAPELVVVQDVRPGYWVVEANGRTHPFGNAANPFDFGAEVGAGTVVDVAAHPDGDGIWALTDDGRVLARGSAPPMGAVDLDAVIGPPRRVDEAVAALAASPDGDGVWVVTDAGRIIALGTATPATQMAGAADLVSLDLDGDVVAAHPTPSGRGMYLAGADGGVFAVGDARFVGSLRDFLPPGRLPDRPVVGIVADSDESGYWMVGADGGVFALDAPFLGSLPAIVPADRLVAPIIGIVPAGSGYLLVAGDGGVFAFATSFEGSAAETATGPVVGLAAR